jgi:hypothetical protein
MACPINCKFSIGAGVIATILKRRQSAIARWKWAREIEHFAISSGSFWGIERNATPPRIELCGLNLGGDWSGREGTEFAERRTDSGTGVGLGVSADDDRHAAIADMRPELDPMKCEMKSTTTLLFRFRAVLWILIPFRYPGTGQLCYLRANQCKVSYETLHELFDAPIYYFVSCSNSQLN